jgi:putative FmdB family regulatory protein
MPIYEYVCKECGKKFEVLQKITAGPLTECKFCSGQVVKLVSNSSFTFKGGGWYITDYQKKNKKKEIVNKNIKTSETKKSESKKSSEDKSKVEVKSNVKSESNKNNNKSSNHKKVS